MPSQQPHAPISPQDRTAWGHYAEDVVAFWFQRQGATILSRNFRCRRGELDIICLHKGELLFIEVRSLHNAHPDRAIASIDQRKQKRLHSAAYAYLATSPHHTAAMAFVHVGVAFQPDGSIHIKQRALEIW